MSRFAYGPCFHSNTQLFLSRQKLDCYCYYFCILKRTFAKCSFYDSKIFFVIMRKSIKKILVNIHPSLLMFEKYASFVKIYVQQ